MNNARVHTGAIAAFGLLAATAPALAASFTIPPDSTSSQTLGSGETGTISDTGLIVSGSGNAVNISGHNATLTNLGTLEQTGTGRAIRDNTGVTGLMSSTTAAPPIRRR